MVALDQDNRQWIRRRAAPGDQFWNSYSMKTASLADEIRTGHMNRAHGFIYLRNQGDAIQLLCSNHKRNDPARGMNVIICAWVKPDGQIVAIVHQSLN